MENNNFNNFNNGYNPQMNKKPKSKIGMIIAIIAIILLLCCGGIAGFVVLVLNIAKPLDPIPFNEVLDTVCDLGYEQEYMNSYDEYGELTYYVKGDSEVILIEYDDKYDAMTFCDKSEARIKKLKSYKFKSGENYTKQFWVDENKKDNYLIRVDNIIVYTITYEDNEFTEYMESLGYGF